MGVESLLEKGDLKRVQKSPERAEKSLEVAKKYLKESSLALGASAFDISIFGAYTAAFHAARAVLYLDGIEERAHYAVVEYLRERHPGIGMGEISRLDMHRKLRHSVAYGLESESGKEDAESALEFAEGFVSRIKIYLKL
jgi:uncharacterized protein (UPF0332 family)